MGFSSRSKRGMHQRSDVVERCVNIVEWCTPLQESSRDTSRNRCFKNRLGWNDIIIGGLRDMDKGGKLPTIQLSQVTGSTKNITIFQNSTTRKSGASTVRQHHNSLLHKQFGRTQSSYDPVDEGDIYPCTQEPNGFVSKILSQVPQLSCRQTVKTIIPVQMENASPIVQMVGREVGTTYNRQICLRDDSKDKQIQLSVLQYRNKWSRCISTNRLGYRKQFHQSAILDDPQDIKIGFPNKVCSHNYCPTLAQPTLVQKASENVSGLSSKNPKSPKCYVKKGSCARADEKHQMENFHLENLWATGLSQQGWSDAAIQQFIMNCTPATWNTYNRQVLMFMEFCCQAGLKATSATTANVTDFMCSLAKLSTCPKAILNTTSAALSQLCRA